MAAIDDLIKQIEDPGLRARIEQEIKRSNKQRKFGLVFEEHLPEVTPLFDVPIKKGSLVAKKQGEISDIYITTAVEKDTIICVNKETNKECTFDKNDMVVIAQFGDPIYPYLKPIDSVCNAPDSELWHTLIEADNYHALQLLEYLYAGKVDCIYIDPPYNGRQKDWKYNNDYVDPDDAYAHSRWLSFMERRLKIAKRLLNPKASVLIVTIDEKEYLHLGCLLEQIFTNAKIQMISSNISQKGIIRANEFTRVDEYIFYVMIGDYKIKSTEDAAYVREGEEVHWQTFRRSDYASRRGTKKGGTSQFYPIYVNKDSGVIEKIGDAIPHDMDKDKVPEIDDCVTVFPMRDDGTEMNWGVKDTAARELAKNGYIRTGKYTPDKPQKYIMQYLMSGTIDAIDEGIINIIGYAENGSIIAENLETKKIPPKTQWNNKYHDARDYGSKVLKQIIGSHKFDFPKSIYAVKDALAICVQDNKNALVLDFFAGSGTTMHAINLMNEEDGGNRRCICVTNNEVSSNEENLLTQEGFKPGDEKWESMGVARYVTWPRTKFSILGQNVNGKPLKGEYVTDNDDELKMANGFATNATYFKLGFLDKTAVALGRQFKELLSVLWMKAGAIGPCPSLARNASLPEMMVLPENKMAILVDETAYADFKEKVNEINKDEMIISTVFLVTDSDEGFSEMATELIARDTFQLYRDYLDNFRINVERK